MSYKNLDIWKEARSLSIDIHQMTLQELPKFEMFEEGAQIRKSVKSIRSNIVEGYGRRRHKADYIKFLDYAFASNLETIDHLETLFETGSLKNETLFEALSGRLEILGKKLNRFILAVEERHNTDFNS
ncbi:MAG: four helix bundle protein [Verrucomicrobiales bacterium]|nr:four helix bundle protein [Verrucomicrobiales bacterium]